VFDNIGSVRLWKRLISPPFSHEFKAFFQAYAIRYVLNQIAWA